MAAQALYRRWRSQTFDEVVGQEHVTQTLRNALRDGRMTHAYLFTGPRGTGKTSTARLLAKAVNCENPDVSLRPCNVCPICLAITGGALLDLIEIDAASNRGIDEIRDLRGRLRLSTRCSRRWRSRRRTSSLFWPRPSRTRSPIRCSPAANASTSAASPPIASWSG